MLKCTYMKIAAAYNIRDMSIKTKWSINEYVTNMFCYAWSCSAFIR